MHSISFVEKNQTICSRVCPCSCNHRLALGLVLGAERSESLPGPESHKRTAKTTHTLSLTKRKMCFQKKSLEQRHIILNILSIPCINAPSLVLKQNLSHIFICLECNIQISGPYLGQKGETLWGRLRLRKFSQK